MQVVVSLHLDLDSSPVAKNGFRDFYERAIKRRSSQVFSGNPPPEFSYWRLTHQGPTATEAGIAFLKFRKLRVVICSEVMAHVGASRSSRMDPHPRSQGQLLSRQAPDLSFQALLFKGRSKSKNMILKGSRLSTVKADSFGRHTLRLSLESLTPSTARPRKQMCPFAVRLGDSAGVAARLRGTRGVEPGRRWASCVYATILLQNYTIPHDTILEPVGV